MSQRGGDVQSNLRIADRPMLGSHSLGNAHVIISLRPLEALRYYLPYLSETIITSAPSSIYPIILKKKY